MVFFCTELGKSTSNFLLFTFYLQLYRDEMGNLTRISQWQVGKGEEGSCPSDVVREEVAGFSNRLKVGHGGG